MTKVADQIVALKGKVIFHIWADELVFRTNGKCAVAVDHEHFKRMRAGDGVVINCDQRPGVPDDVYVGVVSEHRLSSRGPKILVRLSD